MIRTARAEDADFITETIIAAQRGHRARGWFDIALDRPEAQCAAFVRRLTATASPSWWHASRFFIAEEQGIAAAALCGLPAYGALSAARQAMAEAIAAAGIDADEEAAMMRRGAYINTCWMRGDENAWLIEHVATQPDYRRRGLAGALLDHAVAAGRSQGFRTAQITFLIGNTEAEQAYSRAGFRFAEEKRHGDFAAVMGAAGLRRFVREI
jgi:GNAT superfamily N-acetyltransferase